MGMSYVSQVNARCESNRVSESLCSSGLSNSNLTSHAGSGPRSDNQMALGMPQDNSNRNFYSILLKIITAKKTRVTKARIGITVWQLFISNISCSKMPGE